ncbi:unnamed protein product [Cuscuta campestris]|uniref:Uncharacterized protein n=1 Tax=Cuscuta campestris TaxID=132261 RepID=A0A484KFC2_9ASTE|nr:unnamed protein product [Cuscuta campestris]
MSPTNPSECVCGGGGAGAADREGGGGGGAERDAEEAEQLPDLRAVHLLRRREGLLPAVSLLLCHQLQHTKQALRFLLLHAQDL